MKLSALQQYGVVTANYWAFTLTDGALRMLVVFHFHELGYSTLEIAFLFPWAISLSDIGLFGFWSMMAFLGVLTVGFIYEWKKGALEWE